MTTRQLNLTATADLVEYFTSLAIQQGEALLGGNIVKVNRIFDQMEAVKDELKSRPGDQRRALVSLFDHPNAQVRMKAAIANLALSPEHARQVLYKIVKWKEFPQALHAGMTLSALDDGTFKPT